MLRVARKEKSMPKSTQSGALVRLNHLLLGAVLLGVGPSVAIVQYKVPSILVDIMSAYGMTSATGSWLMSIFTAMGIVLSLPTGSLAKKLGPKNVLLLGCSIVVLGSVVGAWATSAWVMIASRAIEGVAFVFVSVAGPLAVDKYVAREHRGTVNGIWSLWICLGSVVGATATPMVFEALGLTGAWLAYAVIVAVAAVVLAVVVRVPKDRFSSDSLGSADRNGVEASELVEPRATARDYLAIIRPHALIFLFAYLVFNIEMLAVLSYTPTFLQSRGMNASLSGFASSLPGLLAVVSSPLIGKLIDKTGRTKPFFVAALLASGPATFLMLTQSGSLLWVGALLMGLIGYGLPVVSFSALPQIAGKRSLLPAATGALTLVMCLGEFLGSLVTPLLLGPDLSNWTFCGAVMLALGLTGAVAAAFCRIK